MKATNIHFFSQSEFTDKPAVLERIGVRGRSGMELASLKVPILPGFIIDADVAADLEGVSLIPFLKRAFAKIEPATGKVFGDPENPMLVKIVISPAIVITTYPGLLHNYGLAVGTLSGFSQFVGPHFANHEILFLIRGNLAIEAKIAELENRSKDLDILNSAIKTVDKELDGDLSLEDMKTAVDKHLKLLPDGFLDDA
jgi:pyruvate,orthophosphate dikinase